MRFTVTLPPENFYKSSFRKIFKVIFQINYKCKVLEYLTVLMFNMYCCIVINLRIILSDRVILLDGPAKRNIVLVTGKFFSLFHHSSPNRT